MSRRKSVSKKTRFEVFKRDGFRCVYCGATPTGEVVLECDHVDPVSNGGADDMENLVTACFDCNRGKSATLLNVIPEALDERAQRIAERDAQMRAYREIIEAEKQRKDDELWEIAGTFIVAHDDDYISQTRLNSIKMFLRRLSFFEVQEAMEFASDQPLGRDRMFRYFCSICWRKIKEQDEE